MSDINNREIEEKLAIIEDGMVMVQVGLLATLYFNSAYTQDTRKAVLEIAEEYWAECGDNLCWMTNLKTFHWEAIKGSPISLFRDHTAKLDEDDQWQITLNGGSHCDEASDFRFEALGSGAWEDDLSYLQVGFPLTWFAERKRKLPALLLSWCQKLKPLHGYGGLGIIQSLNTAEESHYEPQAYAIARRFPGIEVDDPGNHALYLQKHIKGGNWLTVLGDHFVTKLGGVEALKEKLGADFQLSMYPGGLIIQAGPRPQMGDVNRQRIPELYKKLAAVLKPVRITDYPSSFHHAGENRFNKETSNEWLRRFDD